MHAGVKRKRHFCDDPFCTRCLKRRRNLRFKIGDMVEANIGEYALGKIIKIADDCNTYRIEIQDDEKTNVWAPIDHDRFVREAKNVNYSNTIYTIIRDK